MTRINPERVLWLVAARRVFNDSDALKATDTVDEQLPGCPALSARRAFMNHVDHDFR